MRRRLAISLFALLALLLQGMAAAAMVPNMAAAAMSEHCGMAGMQTADLSFTEAESAPAPQSAMKDCCKAGHCVCVAACNAAAVSSAVKLLSPAAGAGLVVAVAAGSVAAAPPPHPFRPPIAS